MGISQAEQIKRIKLIMTEVDKVPDYRFKIGKYNGRTLEYVFNKDPNYLKWVYFNVENMPEKFCEFVQTRLLQ